MSIEVPSESLAETLGGFAGAYLVTVGSDRRAHVVAVTPVLHGARLHAGEPGRTTRGNVEDNATVTLVWPPLVAGGHSLIVDGTGEIRDSELVVAPTRAVLHRPAPVAAAEPTPPAQPAQEAQARVEPAPPAQGEGGCAADCVEVRF